MNVQLPAGYRVSDWEFRLFQAGSYLLELLPSSADTADGLAGTESVPDSQSDPAGVAALAPAVAAAAPGWRKIVVRYRDGHLSKGFTHDFHPSRNQFSLWPSVDAAPSERMFVPASQLKAVFFVRDFQGNADYVEQRTFDGPAEGRRIEVTFGDDEVLVGSTLNYRTDGLGFFLTTGGQPRKQPPCVRRVERHPSRPIPLNAAHRIEILCRAAEAARMRGPRTAPGDVLR